MSILDTYAMLSDTVMEPTLHNGGKAQKVKLTKHASIYPPATKKPNEQGFNPNKWMVSSELKPTSIILWEQALSAVDQSPRHVHLGAARPAMYPFPPAGLPSSAAKMCWLNVQTIS
ncbi:hypothetical protein BU15DRAFT_67558 [Melanogaster broomeanus]|nr:hypothetical protein BU15DRAFT_67558 [Melanogaster broomeanus]